MLIAERADHHSANIEYFSYNDSSVVPGQHCSLTLAQHNVDHLKQYDVNVDCWARR